MTSASTYTYEVGYNPVMGVVTRARGRQKGVQKFLSVDPLTSSFPWYTPYQFAGNKPINSRDLDGLEEVESYTADGIANLYPVPVVGRKMTAIEINYRRNFRAAAGAGYDAASANKYAQLVQGGGPMARALSHRIASGGAPINLVGNISINVATVGITSEFANDVAQFAYDAIMPVLTLPLGGSGNVGKGGGLVQAGRRVAGGLRSSKSLGQALKSFKGSYKLGESGSDFLSGSDIFTRGVSAVSNLQSQNIRNASSGNSGIEVFELGMAIVAPRNFAAQGVVSGAGVRFHPGESAGSEFSFDPSLARSAKGAGIGVGMQHLTDAIPGVGGMLIGIAGKTAVTGTLDAVEGSVSGETNRNQP